jgi:hypothetical protein
VVKIFGKAGLVAEVALVFDCIHCRVFAPAAREIWVFGLGLIVDALALEYFVRGRPRHFVLKKLVRGGPRAALHRGTAEIFIQIFVIVSAILLIILPMAGKTPMAIVALF